MCVIKSGAYLYSKALKKDLTLLANIGLSLWRLQGTNTPAYFFESVSHDNKKF
jgi:hypothetical protein